MALFEFTLNQLESMTFFYFCLRIQETGITKWTLVKPDRTLSKKTSSAASVTKCMMYVTPFSGLGPPAVTLHGYQSKMCFLAPKVSILKDIFYQNAKPNLCAKAFLSSAWEVKQDVLPQRSSPSLPCCRSARQGRGKAHLCGSLSSRGWHICVCVWTGGGQSDQILCWGWTTVCSNPTLLLFSKTAKETDLESNMTHKESQTNRWPVGVRHCPWGWTQLYVAGCSPGDPGLWRQPCAPTGFPWRHNGRVVQPAPRAARFVSSRLARSRPLLVSAKTSPRNTCRMFPRFESIWPDSSNPSTGTLGNGLSPFFNPRKLSIFCWQERGFKITFGGHIWRFLAASENFPVHCG